MKRREWEILLCQESIDIFLARACRSIRGHCVGGHADRAYMLLGMCKPDFVVARLFRLSFCLFYLPPRRASAMGLIVKKKKRERESEGERCSARGRNASFICFVALENRILIALDAFEDPGCSRDSRRKGKRATVIDLNMRQTCKYW